MPKPESKLVQDLFLGCQPILDRTQNLAGFELLFRSSLKNTARIENDLAASVVVFNHLFAELGVGAVLGQYRGFINVTPSLLTSDIVEIIPKENAVLEICVTEAITPTVLERCAQLKKIGYTLALDDFVLGDASHAALLPIVDMVKIDVSVLEPEQLRAVTETLLDHKTPLIAERVEHRKQADHCLALGYEYLQGHYFAKPVVVTGKRLSHSEMAVIRLLGMVLAEVDSGEIVNAMKHHPDLSLSLLKLVNTAAVRANTRITSLNHAIVVLGRAALKRWVQVLLFAGGGTPEVQFPSPLLVLAASRGRLMELIAEKLLNQDRRFQEKAYLAGMLSLMNVHFGMDLAELLKHLPLEQDVSAALLEFSGQLGSMLALTELLEQPGFVDAQFALAEIGDIEPSALLALQMDAMRWANSLGDSG